MELLQNAFLTALEMTIPSTYICILSWSFTNLKPSLRFLESPRSKKTVMKQYQHTESFRVLHLPSKGKLVYRDLLLLQMLYLG